MKQFNRWYHAVLMQSPSNGLPLLFLRLVMGIALMQHGFGKMQTPLSWMGPDATVPGFFQLLAALSEFAGGFAWAVGLLTPLASFGIACTMIFAVYVHASSGAPWIGHGASFESAFSYFAIAIFLLFNGPGRLSLDRKLFK